MYSWHLSQHIKHLSDNNNEIDAILVEDIWQGHKMVRGDLYLIVSLNFWKAFGKLL